MGPDRERDWNPLTEWTFLRQIGKGSQGTTYLAAHRSSSRRAAVKCLSLEETADRDQLLYEAEVLESLEHEAIPDVIDVLERADASGDDWLFVVQEFVAGVSLKEQIEAGDRLNSREIEQLLRQLLEVLAHLHDRSPPLLHRDVKPANVLWTDDGELRLVDFGAARPSDRAVTGDAVIGTAGYVAPEQFFGDDRPASDLYGVGATVLHAASHRHPSEFPMEHLRLRIRGRVGLPESSRRFLERLLEPKPADRFSDASEALRALERTDALPAEVAAGDEGRLEIVRDRNRLVVRFRSRPLKRNLNSLIWMAGFLALLVGAVALFIGSTGFEPLLTALFTFGFTLAHYGMRSLRRWYDAELLLDDSSWELTRTSLFTTDREEGDYEAGLDVLGRETLRLVDYEARSVTLGWAPRPDDHEQLQDAIRGFLERPDAARENDDALPH